MRVGWLASLLAHVGFVLLMLHRCAGFQSNNPPEAGNVVPVEIVATAPESNVRALATPQQADNAPVVAEEATPEPPTPAPAPAPPPTPRPPRPQQDAFNLDSIARMVDRSR